MKNSNETIGNRTRDLRACSAGPQPNAPPRTPAVHTQTHTHTRVCVYICYTEWRRLVKSQDFVWRCLKYSSVSCQDKPERQTGR